MLKIRKEDTKMKKLNLKDVIDNFDLEGTHKHDFVVVISLPDKDVMGDYDEMICDLEEYESYNLVSATLGYENFSLDENENFKFVVRIVLSSSFEVEKSVTLDYEDYSFLIKLIEDEFNYSAKVMPCDDVKHKYLYDLNVLYNNLLILRDGFCDENE